MKKQILFIIFFGIFNSITLKAQDFYRIKYNNANASPDLGVGLWAWPLPLDFDLDGDIDLLVSCPDTPYNGLYFFEKPNRSNNLLMKKPIRIGSGIKNLQVSFINSQPRIIARGLEYKNFNVSVLNDSVRVFKKDSLENLHNKIRFSQWKYVDYENDGDIDIIVGIDEWGDYGWDNAFNKEGQWFNGLLHGYVYLLEKINGEYHFKGKIMAGDTPIDVYGAPSPNMNDFDGDGDLDLILGEFLDRLNYYENIGSRENPKFSMGKFLENESGIIKNKLASLTKADYYPFVDKKLPSDFFDPPKDCVIVSYICSLPSFVRKELEEEDLVAFLDNAGYFYMNCFWLMVLRNLMC